MATEQQRDASLQAECSVVMTFTAYVELVLLSLRVWRYNPLMVQDSRHFWFMATSGSRFMINGHIRFMIQDYFWLRIKGSKSLKRPGISQISTDVSY